MDLNTLARMSKGEFQDIYKGSVRMDGITIQHVSGIEKIFITAVDQEQEMIYIDDRWFNLSTPSRVVAILHEMAYLLDLKTRVAYKKRKSAIGRFLLICTGIDSEFLADDYSLLCLNQNENHHIMVTGAVMEMATLAAKEYGTEDRFASSMYYRAERLRKKYFNKK